MLTTTDFTQEVWSILQDLKDLKKNDPEQFIVSDLVDNQGCQYVDFVQEGGGILGIALVGYTYILEQMGIRFLSLAGTSAGSINTVLLAALGKPTEPKSEKILEVLTTKNFADFMDGGWDVATLVSALTTENKIQRWIGGLISGIANSTELLFDEGLNEGKEFEIWIRNILHKANIKTSDDLMAVMNSLPEELCHQDPKLFAELAIIAADISTETKVIFPKMNDLYFAHPDQADPADFVRASMSIPIFFKPKVIDISHIKRTDEYRLIWREKAKYSGVIPQEVKLVDGGIMSNFPIDVFHDRTCIPNRPTFGVKLGIDRNSTNKINSLFNIIGACFDGARNIRDFEFINNNPDYRQLISYVDIGYHNWLNFEISDKEKIDLFKRGAIAAADFLRNFNWKKYKKTRKELMLAHTEKALDGLWSFEETLLKISLDPQAHADVIEKAKIIKHSTHHYCLLWIDDDPADDYFEMQVLKSLGIKCYTAESTPIAKALLERFTYDIIITDSRRNNNNIEGLEYSKELYKKFPKLPIILHSITQDGAKLDLQQFPNIKFQTLDPRELVINVIRNIALIE
jgi:predicted acylesterase/phospholipase RssA